MATRPRRGDQRHFLGLRVSEVAAAAHDSPSPAILGDGPPIPSICRTFSHVPRRSGGATVLEAPRCNLWLASFVLVFCQISRGVGLAFVSLRGYGRARWLVLDQPKQKFIDETEEPVALPQLTDEQRAAALEKAAAARRVRAELKDRLKRGGTNLKQVLEDAESNEILGKMKVSALLEALPKVGKVKAQEIMTELEIAPTRRLRGLGDRQRRALLEKFDFS